MRDDIGRTDCPVCGIDAAVRESKNRRAYIACEDCSVQVFARGPASDKLIRARMRPPAPPSAAAPVTDAPGKPDASATEAKPAKPEISPKPAKAAPAAPEERTIFDWLKGAA